MDVHGGQTQQTLGSGNWADELANWTLATLVNRTDVFGRYLSTNCRTPGKSNNYTAPHRDDRVDGALTYERLVRHYLGHDHGHLLGIHAISKENTSRWSNVDIDQHGGSDQVAAATTNFSAAVAWQVVLQSLGFHPLLLDSNGAGGFHLWQVFNAPLASETAFSFAKWLVRDHRSQGLLTAPETFPKQRRVDDQRPYGSWCRLPGRHHTRNHWTRIWDGQRWLTGDDAIAQLLVTRGDPPDLIPADARNYEPQANQRRESAACVVAGTGNGSQSDTLRDLLAGKTPGGRHDGLLRLAGHLLGKGVDPVVAEELLVCWNAARNTPPKLEVEIRSTVQDLARRDQQQRASRQALPFGRRASRSIRFPE